MMTIKIDEIRQACNKLLDFLESNGNNEIITDLDFYWNIQSSSLYNVYEDPENMTIGQLSDDLNELRKIINNETEPVGYALVWLSSLLRLIGEKSVR